MQSLPMCAAWLILTSACLALLFVRTNPLESLFLLLLIIYAMHAFVAEALGIRVSKKSISFPRRSIPGFPFLVLWRARIKCADIDQISSRPKVQVRVKKSTASACGWISQAARRGCDFFDWSSGRTPGSAYTGSRPRHRRGRDRLARPRQSWAVTERSSAKSAGAAENKIKMLAKHKIHMLAIIRWQ